MDRLGGMGDLHPGRLRMLSAQAFVEDPLRTLRIARRTSCPSPSILRARRRRGRLGGAGPDSAGANLRGAQAGRDRRPGARRPSPMEHARGLGRHVAGAERATRRRGTATITHVDVQSTRAPPRSDGGSTREPERVRRACPCGCGSCFPGRWPTRSPRAATTARDAVPKRRQPRTPGRHAGRPVTLFGPPKRPEVAGRRPAGIAADWNCFRIAPRPRRAPRKGGAWRLGGESGWVRGGYQAATGGPWA
jgi:hypothetical protein